MYFTKIRLTGLFTTDLPIVNALPSDRYILKNADGLGPPEVDVIIADTVNAGGVYQSRRTQSRELVITIGLNPDYNVGQTPADLRTELYGLLTPSQEDKVTVTIMDGDTPLANTEGYTKRIEIVPFNKEPEVQVTIACLQQYLLAPANLYIIPGGSPGVMPPTGVEIPFDITNAGTATTGFYMEIVITSPQPQFYIADSFGHKMYITNYFYHGDTLILDTRPGFRGIRYKESGSSTESNIIHSLSSDSTWLMLYGGVNNFIASSYFFSWGNVFYRPQYWGI